MKGVTGLCKYCKNRSWWCTDNHYCDSGNRFAPFAPIEGNFDRETLIEKWMKHVKEMNHEEN